LTAVSVQDCAVVLAAHGDRGGLAANATLIAHRDRLRETRAFKAVTAGVFRGDPELEEALREADQSAPKRIFVYPMFMAHGYFSNQKLPERIRGANLSIVPEILAPLGLDQALPPIVMDHAVRAARDSGLDPAHARLLIVGHGSQGSRASAKSTERIACWLRKRQVFAYTEAAFLEERPFLKSQLVGPHPATVVLGFFSGDGLHAAEDVPGAISKSGCNAIYAGSIGRQAIVSDIIKAAVEAAAHRDD
jgi:sirohydrochlorin ferrochelatase